MSNLVLRAALSRPLTHNELDANMQFLEIVEWSVKDFRAGQFAYRTVSNVTSLYLCVETHTQFVYEITDGAFAETITIEGTVTRLWRKVAGGSGGGTGAEFVAAEFDSDTNILTFTTADGDPVPVDLSSLAGGGSGTSGSSGASGSSGSSGASGSSGSSGITGSSGTSGAKGTSGISGTSGLSGDKYKTTSDTSHTLGSSGTITVDTGLSYSVAQSIIIAYNASNFQESEVVSYNSSTGVLVFGAPTRTVGSGTYTSWTVNLDGASGGDGTSGTSGASGSSGTSGARGTSGSSGNSGSSGSSGQTGAAGTSGNSGSSGSSGQTGAAGTSGVNGTSGSSGQTGAAGTSGVSDKYLGTVLAPIDYSTLVVGTPLIVTTTPGLSYSPGQTVVIAYDGSNYVNGNVLTYNDISGQLAITILNVVWGTSGNLTPSESNLQGLAGSSGSSGATGTAGSSGASGTAGSSGSSGQTGSSGSSGLTGTSGQNGTSGVNGTSGSSGLSGSSGSSGSSGNSGTNGSSGLTGTAGTSGLTGTSGINGTSGANGATGTSGSSGETGATGSSGSSGASGTSGAAGAPGTSGTSAAGGGSGVYFVKLQYASGSLAAAPGCFVSAQDPSGNNLLTAPGWTFTRVGANEITITHPEGKFAINAMTHAENTTGNYLSKAVSGASTGVNSLIQAISTKDSMNFKALSGTQTGLNTGAGPFYMYVTWTYPDNDFAI